MEDVPYAFCQAVVSLLIFEDYSKQSEPLSSDAWRSAIDALLMDRINVEYFIGHEDGGWSYYIRRGANNGRYQEITFKELQKLNLLNLRIRKFEIESDTYAQAASFEDIAKLVKFTLPLVHTADLSLCSTREFPQKDLQKLLSYLSNSSIRELSIRDISEETWDALSMHLKSDSLKVLFIIDEDLSAQQILEVKEYLRNSRFTYFISRCPALLDMDMFHYLFNKPQTEPIWEVNCHSSINLEELREYEKHLQFNSESDQISNGANSPEWHRIEWKRQDGLAVEATENIQSNVGCVIRFN